MPIVKVNNLSDALIPVSVSSLGTIVFDNIVFPAGSWVDLDGNEQTYNEVKLDAVSIRVNRRKNIVKSRVSGRDGIIKEFVGIDDYIITVEAVIAPETLTVLDAGQIGVSNVIPLTGFAAGQVGLTIPDEPTELMQNLKLLDDVQDSIDIRCKHLKNTYGVTKVVIEDFNDTKTTADTYVVRLIMIADNLIDLKDFG